MKISRTFFSLIFSSILMIQCGNFTNGKKDGLNIFPVEKDIELGQKVSKKIEDQPNKYPILDRKKHPEVYKYINQMRDKILNSGELQYKDKMVWELKVIKDGNTKNAFCTPGGYIYIYTGLIKYLDTEDQLAGVMGHEMGHADLRHSTRQMTKMYGVELLSSALLGEKESLKKITGSLINLKFSRSHEKEADNASVTYLCPTNYNAAGGSGFFEKISQEGGGSQVQFLSTHPSPDNRVKNINEKKQELNCSGNIDNLNQYQRIKNMLP